MTGFGRSQTELDGLALTVEIASVNRRNLEIAVALPREWQLLERDIQALLREHVNRGKLNVSILGSPSGTSVGFQWDAAGLEASITRLGEVARKHGISWPPGGDALVRLAAQNKADSVLPAADAVSEHVLEQVSEALKAFLEMRRTEGEALGVDLKQRAHHLVELLEEIGCQSINTASRYRDLLLQRLRQLGLEMDLDDERLLKELALFADRCDTSEERTRLNSHLQQFLECLATGSPIGRKLEFILQEMNREFNTIGSKANNIDVNRLVIEAKNEIERIREQIQNIE